MIRFSIGEPFSKGKQTPIWESENRRKRGLDALTVLSLIRPLLWLTNAILFRSLRQDQIAGLQGQAYWQKEENHGQERQPQSLLQRVLRFHG